MLHRSNAASFSMRLVPAAAVALAILAGCQELPRLAGSNPPGGVSAELREEIVRLNLVDAKVALPAELVERALKQGRILFTWKTLRSWIKPSPLPAGSGGSCSSYPC